MRDLHIGCEYYTNPLYPVVVKDRMFRITRVQRTNGETLDIPDNALRAWKHYPLCRRCLYPSDELWEFCKDNTVSPCGKYCDEECRPFTLQSLTQHILTCDTLPCKKLRHFLKLETAIISVNHSWLTATA